MLRNTSDADETSLRFAVVFDPNHTDDERLGPWANVKGLGTGWLNVAAGNLDTEDTYREAVILKSDLVRVYLASQSGASDMDCDDSDECLDITGSFKGPLVVGDLGENITTPELFEITPTVINRSVFQGQTIPAEQLQIKGEKAIGVPIQWWAIPLPRTGSAQFRRALNENPELSYTISKAGVTYLQEGKQVIVPSVPWITLSAYTGTAPSNITVSFSDTMVGSPLAQQAIYRAFIQVWQDDGSNTPIGELVKFTDVTVTVGNAIYLPIIIQ
ncbi:MAG: hypothetical protein AAF629_10470 [Chloroflexota bacterium]